jgi:hypothetical protein
MFVCIFLPSYEPFCDRCRAGCQVRAISIRWLKLNRLEYRERERILRNGETLLTAIALSQPAVIVFGFRANLPFSAIALCLH